PNKPLKEFKVMKMVEVAAASLALVQPNRISKGLKKIPPPICSMPDNRPIRAPKNRARGVFTGLLSGCSVGRMPRSRMVGRMSAKPRSMKETLPSSAYRAPGNAQGMDVIRKGQQVAQRKCPARRNCRNPVPATSILSIKISDLYWATGTEKREKTAM